MLNLIKLAVGVTNVDDLRARQAQRTPLRHRTRNFPRRAQEILAGGSIYWVIARMVTVRQPIRDIVVGTWDDGTRCTDLLLAPELIAVRPRAVKPFQGWRYLEAADAPRDAVGSVAGHGDALPEALRRDLMSLALL